MFGNIFIYTIYFIVYTRGARSLANAPFVLPTPSDSNLSAWSIIRHPFIQHVIRSQAKYLLSSSMHWLSTFLTCKKYCRSDLLCDHHWGKSFDILCPSDHGYDSVCFISKLLQTGYGSQLLIMVYPKVKKIIATEKVSCEDVLIFKKNNCYISAFKYSDVNNQSPISEIILKTKTSLCDENFPGLTKNHHFFNSKLKSLNILLNF